MENGSSQLLPHPSQVGMEREPSSHSLLLQTPAPQCSGHSFLEKHCLDSVCVQQLRIPGLAMTAWASLGSLSKEAEKQLAWSV